MYDWIIEADIYRLRKQLAVASAGETASLRARLFSKVQELAALGKKPDPAPEWRTSTRSLAAEPAFWEPAYGQRRFR